MEVGQQGGMQPRLSPVGEKGSSGLRVCMSGAQGSPGLAMHPSVGMRLSHCPQPSLGFGVWTPAPRPTPPGSAGCVVTEHRALLYGGPTASHGGGEGTC